jgi:hypothetical protein
MINKKHVLKIFSGGAAYPNEIPFDADVKSGRALINAYSATQIND